MKIFAIAGNYGRGEHELTAGIGADRSVWYEIPDSALLRNRQPWFLPDFAEDFRLYPTVIYRVSRLGKGISRRFAGRYIDRWTAGCAAVATDLLHSLRACGAPWSAAVAFDRCCITGDLRTVENLNDNLRFTVRCGDTSVNYDTAELISGIDAMVESLSRENTIKEGDMILAGLFPYGITPVIGSHLTISEDKKSDNDNETDNGQPLLEINIR